MDEPRPLTVVELQVVPGGADQFAEIARELVRESRKEPGCVRYEIHQDLEDPLRFTLLEQFQDTQAVLDHLERLRARYGPPAPEGGPHAPPAKLGALWQDARMRRVVVL